MNNQQIPKHTPMLEWQAPDAAAPDRGKVWYTIAGAFVLFCTIYSIWTKAWTFTLMIVLGTGTFWKFGHQEPEEKRMRIWEEGYALNEEFVPWKHTHGFWILKMPGHVELHIEHINGKTQKIFTGDKDPYMIYELLAQYTQGLEDRREGILDTFIRICKL